VSRLALNAKTVKVLDAYRSTVTNLEKSADGLNWTQLDDALPLPLDFNNAMTPVLLDVSDIAAFDRLILKVDSLEAGNYQLSIDNKPIAVFSSEQLQHGGILLSTKRRCWIRRAILTLARSDGARSTKPRSSSAPR